MLVLTRKTGEQVVIGGQVVLTVLSVSPTRVRVGIEAPDDVSIGRPDAKTRPPVDDDQAADPR